TIVGSTGQNAFQVGDSNHLLSGIAAPLHFQSVLPALLTVNGTADIGNRTGTVAASGTLGTGTRLGMPATADYQNSQLRGTLGSGADTLNVTGTITETVIDANNPGDTVNVFDADGPVTVHGGSATLNVDRRSAAPTTIGSLTSTQVTGLGMAQVNYDTVGNL